MTPHEHLGFAHAAMTDADHAASAFSANSDEHLALSRAQAHALVGILRHLIGPPPPPKLVFDEHPKMAPEVWAFDDADQPSRVSPEPEPGPIERCSKLPAGWKCIRQVGHQDGCFVYPEPEQQPCQTCGLLPDGSKR